MGKENWGLRFSTTLKCNPFGGRRRNVLRRRVGERRGGAVVHVSVLRPARLLRGDPLRARQQRAQRDALRGRLPHLRLAARRRTQPGPPFRCTARTRPTVSQLGTAQSDQFVLVLNHYWNDGGVILRAFTLFAWGVNRLRNEIIPKPVLLGVAIEKSRPEISEIRSFHNRDWSTSAYRARSNPRDFVIKEW